MIPTEDQLEGLDVAATEPSHFLVSCRRGTTRTRSLRWIPATVVVRRYAVSEAEQCQGNPPRMVHGDLGVARLRVDGHKLAPIPLDADCDSKMCLWYHKGCLHEFYF